MIAIVPLSTWVPPSAISRSQIGGKVRPCLGLARDRYDQRLDPVGGIGARRPRASPSRAGDRLEHVAQDLADRARPCS